MKSYYDEFYSQKDFIHFQQDKVYIQHLCSFLPELSQSSVLDVGCGRGYWSKLFYECGVGHVVGIDISSVGLEIARRAAPGVEFILADARNLQFIKNTFDMVFCQGLSEFNVDDISKTQNVGLQLLDYVNNQGLFVFSYSTNLSGKRKNGWMQHKKEVILNYLTSLGCQIEATYFIDRVIFLKILGKNVIKGIFSKYTLPTVSRLSGLPVLMVCVARKKPDIVLPEKKQLDSVLQKSG
jgi:SAM-dependent methyltransferase